MMWSAAPTDEVLGYVPTEALVRMTDENLYILAKRVGAMRYDPQHPRNRGNAWLRLFDPGEGRTVLDYGCGIGVEALRLMSLGYDVGLYDIQPLLEIVAYRTAQTVALMDVREEFAFHLASPIEDRRYDIIYSNGVLHHDPRVDETLGRLARNNLTEGGLILLGLYTDSAWRDVVGTEPSVEFEEEGCLRFGEAMEYPLKEVTAEAWWPEKIEQRWPFLRLERWDVLPGYDKMAAARLRLR